MAHRYGVTPSSLVRQTLGDFGLDIACFEAWAEKAILENKSAFSKKAPAWKG